MPKSIALALVLALTWILPSHADWVVEEHWARNSSKDYLASESGVFCELRVVPRNNGDVLLQVTYDVEMAFGENIEPSVITMIPARFGLKGGELHQMNAIIASAKAFGVTLPAGSKIQQTILGEIACGDAFSVGHYNADFKRWYDRSTSLRGSKRTLERVLGRSISCR